MTKPLATATRAVLFVFTASAVMTLSACMIPPPPSVTTAPESQPAPSDTSEGSEPSEAGDPHASEEPTEPSETGDSSGGETFTFEDGSRLTSDSMVAWSDGFITSDDWDVTMPDDGQGKWQYSSSDGRCWIEFWQGRLDGVDLTGDESVDSDALMATFLEAETAEVTDAAADGGISYQTPGNDGLEVRYISVTDDDGEGDAEQIFLARAFSAVGIGVYSLIGCEKGYSSAALDSLNEENAVMVVE